MADAWETLRAAGVPDGAARRQAAGPGDEEVAVALDQVCKSGEAIPIEPLLAWLSAFHHHWPSRFEASLGARGRTALAQLGASPIDANRYLKLRRIAVANLAARFR